MKKEGLAQKLALLEAAIEKRNKIIFFYDNLQRVVEPYHYGILGNEVQLHSFQVAGSSNSGGTPQWRNFIINKMIKLYIQNANFKLRTSYNPGNSHYQIVYSVNGSNKKHMK